MVFKCLRPREHHRNLTVQAAVPVTGTFNSSCSGDSTTLAPASPSSVPSYANLSGKLIDSYSDLWNNVNDSQGVDSQSVSALEAPPPDLVYLLQHAHCPEFADTEHVVRSRTRTMRRHSSVRATLVTLMWAI